MVRAVERNESLRTPPSHGCPSVDSSPISFPLFPVCCIAPVAGECSNQTRVDSPICWLG